MIRPATRTDAVAVMKLAEASGLFDSEGVEHVEAALAGYLDGDSDDLWFIAEDHEPVGVAYCAPEAMTDGTWNVLMLIVSPDHHGRGHGETLMRHAEETLATDGCRLLIVETSGLDSFKRVRAFYAKCGYHEEARIRDFYTAGDDKVVYSKKLTGGTG